MSCAVASSSTFQRLANTRGVPEYMNPRTMLIRPSPLTSLPSPVSQALSTTSSAARRVLFASQRLRRTDATRPRRREPYSQQCDGAQYNRDSDKYYGIPRSHAEHEAL